MLADKFNEVIILYKGFIADEDGLPFLNAKEVDAIAAFCMYANTFKAGLGTRDQGTLQIAQLMEQK